MPALLALVPMRGSSEHVVVVLGSSFQIVVDATGC